MRLLCTCALLAASAVSLFAAVAVVDFRPRFWLVFSFRSAAFLPIGAGTGSIPLSFGRNSRHPSFSFSD
ncbi:MAG: hypothetical protein JO099_07585 [Acidobacteriia bacterium]|nr:hypothetical protein [Terriglobia bacterium]